MDLIKPIFVDADPNTVINEMVAWYEAETGKTLQPAQVERLLINGLAYREVLIRNQINETAVQNMVDFAVAPILDYLGALVGVTRLPESPAYCNILFTLVPGHGSVVIPDGLRVSTTDGKFVFRTQEPVTVGVGIDTTSIYCVCDTPGVAANGYIADTVKVIIDPQAFLSTASNTDTTSGGGDEETDAQLRDRIKLAPEAFSTAGSVGAYKFHAKSADPSIIDVAVTSPVPGQVNLYPLVEGGISTPPSVIVAVENICSGEKVRPLTDTVQVISPTSVAFTIDVDITVLPDADPATVSQQVTDALTAFSEQRKTQLGRDVLKTQIAALCMIDGVYTVDVIAPAADLVVNGISFANCTGVTVNIVGINEG